MTTAESTPQEQCSTGIQGAPAWYTEEQIVRAVPAERARRLLEATLRSGFRPEDDPGRSNVPAGEGHLLLMPSVIGDWAGIKIASVSPGNPERDLPRIQATYMLIDSATLSLRALLEGNVLTTLRTPAISAVATDYLAPKEATKLVVFGTGPQALAHIAAFAEIRSFTEVVVCGRTPRKVHAAVDYARTLGLAARSGDASEVRDADVVVCTTSAAEPLFDGALVPDTACIVAMGSHEHVPPAHSDVAVQDPPHGQPHREERERGESVQPGQAVGVDEGWGIQRAPSGQLARGGLSEGAASCCSMPWPRSVTPPRPALSSTVGRDCCPPVPGSPPRGRTTIRVTRNACSSSGYCGRRPVPRSPTSVRWSP